MDELTKIRDADLCSLSDKTLADLPEGIGRPNYDRSSLTPGIVHIGLGNFHRAHQAWYLHRLMQAGHAHDWAIIGASVRKEDRQQRERLAQQDYLTTLIELDPSGTSAEVIGSIIGYVPIEDGHAPLIEQLSDPQIRIVTLTITEGGYFLDPATKHFDANHPDIQYDAKNLDHPRTVFGALIRALQNRQASGVGPFTLQSCDNLPGNGSILREVVLGFSALIDPELKSWIEEHVSFPNSMVDCIVPATGPNELSLVQSLGVLDQAPVTHENFRQWVIEDTFCAGRPNWEDAGATFSDHVHDFEAMKLRLLNGGHQIVAAPAELLGLDTIADAMAHKLIRGLLHKVALTEVAPHVPSVPGMTTTQYIELIESRFANPAIHDTVRRVAFDGSSRHTGAVIPAIRDAIAAGSPIEGLALSQALWALMCAGQREDGSKIAPNDPEWDDLTLNAQKSRTTPKAWLDQSHLYGAIAEDARFVEAFTSWITMLRLHGVEYALRSYMDS